MKRKEIGGRARLMLWHRYDDGIPPKPILLKEIMKKKINWKEEWELTKFLFWKRWFN